jgi:hypothetical protein
MTLARLGYDEPVMDTDHDTGIQLQFRFEDVFEGKLRLYGGILRDDMLCVCCEPDDISTSATIILDGIKIHLK